MMVLLLWCSGGNCVVKWSLELSRQSAATGRVTQAVQIEGEDPDKKEYPGAPCWVLGVRPTTSSRKKVYVWKPFKMPQMGLTNTGRYLGVLGSHCPKSYVPSWVYFRASPKDFSLLQTAQTGSRVLQPYSKGIGVLYQTGKADGAWSRPFISI